MIALPHSKKFHDHHIKLYKVLKKLSSDKITSKLISIERFTKGQYLTEERQEANGIYFILEGHAKIFNVNVNKKIQILRLASVGDIVGLSCLNSNYYWASSLVEDNIKAYFISLNNLEYLLKTDRIFSFLMITEMSIKLRHYKMRQNISMFPATERIIDALFLIAYKFGKKTENGIEVSTCVSRKDISSLSDTSIENTIRTLSMLKSENFIDIQNKVIIITNEKQLKDKLIKYCKLHNLSTDLIPSYPNVF
jgi:CRP/FNR family transcriptional regulator